MIVYKMVAKEGDGRLFSLMEKGRRQVEYEKGRVSYPATGGVLYARDSLEVALEAVKGYRASSIPDAELWTAEATEVSPTAWHTIVGCGSLTLLEKIYPDDCRI